MPTINEVWEQTLRINANLATIHNDLVSLGNCCNATNQRLADILERVDETNDWLEALRQVVNDGFAAMSSGIAGIHARQDITNRLLLYHAEQQRTMICISENISRNTCHLWDQAAQQTEMQQRVTAGVEALQNMYASTNADAALVYQRHVEDRRKLEECCPPPPRKPACVYEPCPAPGELGEDRLEKYPGYEAKPTKVVRRKRQDHIG
jgi:hypothetical protein